MLELISINKDVEDFQLRSVYLTIEKGDYWVFLGNSGSGKTLLLEIIAGILKPENGNVDGNTYCYRNFVYFGSCRY